MITILRAGLLTTVQDEGRWGYQAYGMPVAGVMDRYAYRLANLLVGNRPGAAALEMTLRGDEFRFEQSCLVAVCGANMRPLLDGRKIDTWSAVQISPGSELHFDYAVAGCRAYLAVRGGIDVPMVLGSRSTYTRGRVGGLNGRALRQGDTLQIGTEAAVPAGPRKLEDRFIPRYEDHVQLRVLLGPQDDCFTPQGLETLFNSVYTVSTEADRMGYRLEGPVIEHRGKPDIVSDALCQGAIQVPGHGMPIVMMADRQTTGGYTKVGTVIGPDLFKLAQAKTGDTISFVNCTEDEALAALKAERMVYDELNGLLRQALSDGDKPLRCFNITVNGIPYRVEIKEE